MRFLSVMNTEMTIMLGNLECVKVFVLLLASLMSMLQGQKVILRLSMTG